MGDENDLVAVGQAVDNKRFACCKIVQRLYNFVSKFMIYVRIFVHNVDVSVVSESV